MANDSLMVVSAVTNNGLAAVNNGSRPADADGLVKMRGAPVGGGDLTGLGLDGNVGTQVMAIGITFCCYCCPPLELLKWLRRPMSPEP